MDEKDMNQIITLISSKYKSLESPDFSFVNDSISDQPYRKIIDEIKKTFHVEEDTDLDDDVSFAYLLTKERGQWLLRLSMVGPYSVLLVFDELENVEVVSSLMRNPAEPEKEIINLLSKNGIRLLNQYELFRLVPLKLFNAEPENTRIYQALFTDTDILPWEGIS